ncbi:hypothetical protein V8G54_009179 [Vigna mungo]|uniref:Uncharacterized protein n=1 Tax=Vigna mungo TaxID=3915 RepID=A0AAQ3NW90_VIGMU
MWAMAPSVPQEEHQAHQIGISLEDCLTNPTAKDFGTNDYGYTVRLSLSLKSKEKNNKHGEGASSTGDFKTPFWDSSRCLPPDVYYVSPRPTSPTAGASTKPARSSFLLLKQINTSLP